jgi:4-hydroxy-2-oxoheptanedioate aldolase
MPAPTNKFKAAILNDEKQIGLWMGLANAYTAEICAGAGFDWLVIDGEHAPNDLQSILGQLQALSNYPVNPVVRVPIGETWLIKQVLDLGAQNILVPMVESAEQAKELVRAIKYPPAGVRGVGAALARASQFNRIGDYLQTANDQTCLIVQVESQVGVEAIEEIGQVEGVDGIFIGPADLAADMGYLGRPGEQVVKDAVLDGIARIVATGKAAGILSADKAFARACLDQGANFVAVGTDVTLFSGATSKLAEEFTGAGQTAPAGDKTY